MLLEKKRGGMRYERESSTRFGAKKRSFAPFELHSYALAIRASQMC